MPKKKQPINLEYIAMSTGLPYEVDKGLRVLAGYAEGEITPGREFAVIAKGILHLAAKVHHKQ